jgi:uncharacterized protein DUF5666
MNDETRTTASDPIAPTDGWLAEPSAPGESKHAATPAAARFTGRTHPRSEAVRAGVIVGTGLLLALGAAVAMGASPSASPTTGQTQTVPGGGAAGLGQNAAGPLDPDGRGFGPGGPGRGDRHGFGRVSVTAISGTSLSLATEDGWTRTISVTTATKIAKGGAAATLADIAVGDTIRFGQTRNADGTYTITAIEIVQPQVAGIVTAVGSDTITLTLRDGTSQTIRTTGSTTYHVERADGTRASVTVGSMIVARGEKAADGTLTASSVWVRLPHVAGTVTGTTATTITLTRRDGTTVTVHVDSDTTYRVAGIAAPTLSDIKTGMAIVVQGTQRADGSIDASAIAAGDRAGLGRGRGHDGPKDVDPNASAAPDASAGTDG